MANFPGPYEIEFTLYNATADPPQEHVFRVSCACVVAPTPGDAPSTISIQKAGGGSGSLDVVVNQLWSYLRLMYADEVVAIGYTFWKYAPLSLSKQFITAGELTTPAGNTGSTADLHYIMLTFRGAAGGIVKLTFLEPNLASNDKIPLTPNVAGTPMQRIAAYVMSSDNIILCRDDTFPVAALRQSGGQNEHLWKKLYRP